MGLNASSTPELTRLRKEASRLTNELTLEIQRQYGELREWGPLFDSRGLGFEMHLGIRFPRLESSTTTVLEYEHQEDEGSAWD